MAAETFTCTNASCKKPIAVPAPDDKPSKIFESRSQTITVKCPHCGTINYFTRKSR